ncbi:hypothetical protein DEHRE_13940 [Dehalobacter restrictus DSM 9455]|uniref:Uncharacterized protein n=1 Tax=Dehalobacter restrictus (strain DSM 9455 / PER-K23) TaxID=871738 RepID=A0ABN4BVT3_DEHRP|nr:hypothetical protein DEHRE_13940 [Dehalobacter restrictus DSM 9455]
MAFFFLYFSNYKQKNGQKTVKNLLRKISNPHE